MRITKTLGLVGALLVSALLGGTLIGSALATDETGQPSATEPANRPDVGAYCDTFLDAFASELGVSRDQLTAAGKSAIGAVLDQAVADGRLSADQADKLHDRIGSFEGDGCAILKGGGWLHGFGPANHGRTGDGGFGFGFGGLTGNAVKAAADALGLDAGPGLLRQAADAGSLQALAEKQNVSYDTVKAAVTDAVKADLAKAVDNGRLTQERADAAVEKLSTWLDDGGKLPSFGPMRHRNDGGNEDSGA